jgi:hypothetical protein
MPFVKFRHILIILNRSYHKSLFLEETPIILTDIQHRLFMTVFEPFLVRQETYIEKEFKKLNEEEILHKSHEQLLSGMTEELSGMIEERKYDDKWHKAVRKVLVTTMEGTHRFWRQNVAQILPKEPESILEFYGTMTAIYLGPREGRSAELKKIIPRVNKILMLVSKSFWMHNQKSVNLFRAGVAEWQRLN